MLSDRQESLRQKAYALGDALPDQWSPHAARKLVECFDAMSRYLVTILPRNHPARRTFTRDMKDRTKQLNAVPWDQVEQTEQRKREYQVLRLQLAMFKDGIDARFTR